MNFKLGRTRPDPQAPRLKLANYLTTAVLPTPPERVGYAPKAAHCLGQMFLNDRLSDCTSAAAFHINGVFEANAGRTPQYTDAEVEAFYSATTGYDPNDPSTDQGGDEITVLKYWKAQGLFGSRHKIAGWVSVDGSDKNEVMTALYLFENCYFGVELPDQWVNPFPSGWFTWSVAGPPNPNQGHAFAGTGYVPEGVLISTWGLRGVMTWDAVAKYASTKGSGELYAVFSHDALAEATGKAPSGFDATQLAADLLAIGQR